MKTTGLQHLTVFVVALILVLSGVTGVVVGAGETSVELRPASEEITIGSTTTFDIVVTDASGGVGAVNVTASLSSGDVATITGISLDDSASSVEILTNEDNTSATIVGYGLDTADSGSVVVGTVTIKGDSSGDTDLQVQANALGDESGTDYSVSSVAGSTVTVMSDTNDGGNGGGGGDGGGGGGDGTATTTTTTTTEPNSATTTEQTGSQAPGFGPLTTIVTIVGSIIFVLARQSN